MSYNYCFKVCIVVPNNVIFADEFGNTRLFHGPRGNYKEVLSSFTISKAAQTEIAFLFTAIGKINLT